MRTRYIVNSTLFIMAFAFHIMMLTTAASSSKAAQSITNDDCLECHKATDLRKTKKGQEISLYINKSIFDASIHGKLRCIECHSDIFEIPHEKELAPVKCDNCHAAEAKEYAKSIHGKAFAAGIKDVPTCSTCHGKHNIKAVKDPTSAVFPYNLPKICLKCHLDKKIETEYKLPAVEYIKAYENSVHGKALAERGITIAAVCTDCHGTHNIKPADDPQSSVYKTHIPEDCKKCHLEIYNTYQESVHGKAIDEGNLDAPVCTDCHGEHTIAAPTTPESTIAPGNVSKTCAACHESKKIVTKYGLPAKRYITYSNSYHGIASKYGNAVVANCASCHGAHDIRPSSDPKSSINKANLPKTCGKCHPGVNENVAKGKIHIEATKESSKGVFYVRNFYTWFIGILMVCFAGYVAMELYGFRKTRAKKGR